MDPEIATQKDLDFVMRVEERYKRQIDLYDIKALNHSETESNENEYEIDSHFRLITRNLFTPISSTRSLIKKHPNTLTLKMKESFLTTCYLLDIYLNLMNNHQDFRVGELTKTRGFFEDIDRYFVNIKRVNLTRSYIHEAERRLRG